MADQEATQVQAWRELIGYRGFGIFHVCKCLAKVLKKHTITDGDGRASMNTIATIACSESTWGALIAKKLPKNIFAHWDVQSDEVSFQLSRLYADLPPWSSHTVWPEQILHWSAVAKEQPTREHAFFVGIVVTRVGFVMLSDVIGHRIWKLQQSNVADMKVVAGCGSAGPPGEKEARLKCKFDKPTSLMLVCDDSSPRSQEHLVVVDFDNRCFRLIENIGAIRNSSIGAVHNIPSPMTLPRPFSIAPVTSRNSAVMWPWRFVMSSRVGVPTIYVLELSWTQQSYHTSSLISIQCSLDPIWSLVAHSDEDTVVAACRRYLVTVSLSQGKIISQVELFEDARGVCFNERGDLLVSDYERHNVSAVCDGIIVATWGDGKAGNSDGTEDTTRFDGPSIMACDGNSLLVICGGPEWGARLVRCGTTVFLKQYLFHLNMLYKFLNFVGRSKPIQLPDPPIKNLQDGLQRFGWPACRFFLHLVQARHAHTGRDLRYMTDFVQLVHD